MNIKATEKGSTEKSWTLDLGEQITATSTDGSTFIADRNNVKKHLIILDGLLFRRTISFKKPLRKVMQLDPQSYKMFCRWLGYRLLLKIFLRSRFSWTLMIGVAFIISSLPMNGDPASGIASVPFNPLNMGMGFSLILVGIFAKKFPDRMYFLIDSGWFALLTITTIISVLKGDSMYWLIFAALQASLIVSGILIWQRLKEFERMIP